MTVFPVCLEPWVEAFGQLHELREQDCYLEVGIGPTTFALPSELKEKLKDCLGQRICILRTDTDYRIRILDELGLGDDMSTASELTIEHNGRPEVRKIISRFALSEQRPGCLGDLKRQRKVTD